ncbi:MAG: hypothetical protein ACRDWN_05355, partial [Acidimicrobiales bacterium]
DSSWVTGGDITGQSTGNAEVSLSWTLRPTATGLSVTGSSTLGAVPAGLPLTLVATLTSTASGKVDFSITGTAVPPASGGTCTAVPVVSHEATCTTAASAGIGAHAYLATFGANAAFAQSSSPSVSATSVADPTAVSKVTGTGTAAVDLKATVTPPPYAPRTLGGGKVFFYAQPVGTPAATRHLACTQTVPANLAAGAAAAGVECLFELAVPGTTYTLSATFVPAAGTLDNSPAASATGTAFKVTRATPTVTLSVLPGQRVTYGQQVTLRATITGLPPADRPPAKVTYEGPGGAPITCAGTGQEDPAPVTVGNGVAGPCTFTPGTGGTAPAETVTALYAGDAETNASPSGPATIAVARAASTTTLTVTPSGGVGAVGVPVTLKATVSDPTEASAVPAGSVDLEMRTASSGQMVAAPCTSQATAAGVTTCTLATPPATIATLTFQATYCPAATAACTDWIKSTSRQVAYTPAPDPVAVTLAPAGTQTHPATVTTPTLTVTATVAVAVPTSPSTPPVAGTVAFTENGQPVGSCSSVPVGGPGTASCTFDPVTGAEDAVVAAFTPVPGSLTTAATSAPAYYKVAGLATATALAVATPTGDPLDYGVPLTATATVSTVTNGTPVTAGTVAFAVGGTPVPTCTAQAVGHQGTATCALPPVPGPSGTVTATFAYAGGTYQRSAYPAALSISPDATTTTLSISPDVTTPGDIALTATVAGTAVGAVVAPSGAVGFTTTGGAAVPGCAAVPLVPGSGTASTATCPLARPTATTTFGAAYAPVTSADFSPSSAATGLAFNPSGACSTAFQHAWDDAGHGLTLSAGGLSSIGSVTVDLGQPVGTCGPTRILSFNGGSLSLFGGTLATSSGISGYLVDGQGAGATPQLCLTGGALGLPGSWSLGTVALSATEKLCVAVTSVTGTSGTAGGIDGSIAVSAPTLPFGLPTAGYQLTVSFVAGASPSLTVRIGPTTPPDSAPYVTATVTVTRTGAAFTATGALRVGNIPFLGGLVGGTFAVGTGTGGTIAWSVTLAVPATATYSPVPGLTLEGLSVKLSSASGLTVGATVVLGTGTTVTGTLAGSYSAGKWTLSLAPTSVGPWVPTPGLTLSPTISGTLTVTTAGPTSTVTYDFETAASATLASWTLGAGFAATVDCV